MLRNYLVLGLCIGLIGTALGMPRGDKGPKRLREPEKSSSTESESSSTSRDPHMESAIIDEEEQKKKKKGKSSQDESKKNGSEEVIKHRIGIIGALAEEVAELEKLLKNSQHHKKATFDFITGVLHGKEVVVARSGVGVIYAASVATTMIETYKATTIIFTGVAGGIKEGAKIGDIIVAKDLINYEMNCKNFFLAWDKDYRHKLGEYPFMNGLREFASDSKLLALAMEAPLGDSKVKRVIGRVVTGSEFHNTSRKKELAPLWEELGGPDAVEMEGVAVAQIAHAYKVPFLVLRSLSDTLEGDASTDFNVFAKEVAELLIPIVTYIVDRL